MPFYMNLYVAGKAVGVRAITGWDHSKCLVIIDRQINTVYESPESMGEYRNYVIPKLRDKKFRDTFVSKYREADVRLLKCCRAIRFKDYAKTSLAECTKDLKEFTELFRFKFGIYGLPKFTDLAIQDILPEIIGTKMPQEDQMVLSKPITHSEYVVERTRFLKIIREIKERGLEKLFQKPSLEVVEELGRFHPELYFKIETHAFEFEWLNANNHHVQPVSIDCLIDNIKNGLRDETAEKELEHLENDIPETLKTQKKLLASYALSPKAKGIMDFIQNLNELNESRKSAMAKAILWSYPLFQTLAFRLKTDAISLRQLTAEEMQTVIKRGKLIPAERKLMAERLDYYFCKLEKGVITHAGGSKARMLAERELGKTDYTSITELSGRVAQPGNVKGVARVILSEPQVNELREGEILVASMTDPNMVSAMKRAAAIVTDEGGITCHAAIVSRELGVPCIIGTKIATKIFKTGDKIEVDTDKGKVRKISA